MSLEVRAFTDVRIRVDEHCFSLQASEATSERLFSAAGRVFTPSRAGLTFIFVELSEYLFLSMYTSILIRIFYLAMNDSTLVRLVYIRENERLLGLEAEMLSEKDRDDIDDVSPEAPEEWLSDSEE